MTSGSSSRKAKAQAAAPRGGANKAIVGAVVAVLVVVAVVVAVALGSRGRTATPGAGSTVSSSASALPVGATGPGGGIVVNAGKARPGAPTLDLYEDFQCPICAQLEKLFGPQIRSLAAAGDIRLVIHMMSFLDDNLKNDSSLRAANAAACAADVGRFSQYHDAVFAGQPAKEGQGYTDAQLEGFAKAAGITGGALTTWRHCVATGQHTAYVRAVQTQSEKDGVFGTPTLKLNGKVLDLQKLTPDSLAAQVKAATR
jgi:protein-disulfide isomerase